MNVLFLTNNLITRDLSDWVSNVAHENVHIIDQKITPKDIEFFKPEFLISYNYRFIIKKEILDIFGKKAINLQISYLLFNKGTHPNLWSIVENTSKGVTIHCLDEGLDTGEILFQKPVTINENSETLESSYKLLHTEIQELLKNNWDDIKSGKAKTTKQKNSGTYQTVSDYKKCIEPVIAKTGWNISVKKFIHEYYEYNKNREKENR